MALCNIVAGIPKAECNAMRKMMKPVGSGNENIEKAQALKNKFVTGAVANGVSRHIAEDLYEKILFFAGYGFNKSHAVAYSIVSYHCAWFMTYYEEEWIKAYLEACSYNPKKRAKAIAEVKSLGYRIVPIDINYAEKTWTSVGDKKLMPSFFSCKGVGEAAIEEILENRPYRDIYDLLWHEDGSWKHSKMNKKALEHLIKVRALESLNVVGESCPFHSYKQMSDILIDGYPKFKKSLKKNRRQGIDNFEEALNSMEIIPEWSTKELMAYENDILGAINVEAMLAGPVLQKLEEKEVLPLDEWHTKDFYWFMVTSVVPKLTKNKKPYLLLNGISSTGKISRVFCWGTGTKAVIEPYQLCIAEIDKNDFGCSTRWQRVKLVNL